MRTYLTALAFTLIVSIMPTSSVQANTTMTTSWYGPGMKCYQTKSGCLFLMANGKQFDMNDSTVVAHKTLPFGTKLKLTHPDTDVSIVVVVQDRGPYIKGRDLDLSKGAAKKIGIIHAGEAELIVEILD